MSNRNSASVPRFLEEIACTFWYKVRVLFSEEVLQCMVLLLQIILNKHWISRRAYIHIQDFLPLVSISISSNWLKPTIYNQIISSTADNTHIPARVRIVTICIYFPITILRIVYWLYLCRQCFIKNYKIVSTLLYSIYNQSLDIPLLPSSRRSDMPMPTACVFRKHAYKKHEDEIWQIYETFRKHNRLNCFYKKIFARITISIHCIPHKNLKIILLV